MNYKPFTILTESGYRYHRLKRYILRLGGKILGRKVYGPMSVYQSLIRGLDELKKEGNNIIYNVNPSQKDIHNTVVVLMGKDTLRYALDLKKQGKIKKLLAGPNISSPLDQNDIFFDAGIDMVLCSCQWIANYFIYLKPNLANKIRVWAAGVNDCYFIQKNKEENINLVIYKKDIPDDMFNLILEILDKKNILFTIIKYGYFNQSDYLSSLKDATGLIYLQTSETQGIALHEAWMMNVPTLVWNRGYCRYKSMLWYDTFISAPYLDNYKGIFFGSLYDFEEKLNLFIQNIVVKAYNPRNNFNENFSDIASVKNILSLINNLND